MSVPHVRIRATIQALREKATQLRDGRPLNEETTKASLIAPLLASLGWDPSDPEDIQYEYRRTSKDAPVDYALMLQRTPCLFVEAKALGTALDDRKWTNQAISYATQTGVGWVVLTNGIDYCVYNAHAPVPLEAKLFKRISLVESPVEVLLESFALLSKSGFVGKRIDRVWDAHHTDAQVKSIVLDLFDAASPASAPLVEAIVSGSGGRLTEDSVRGSLLRASIRVSFPPVPEGSGSAGSADLSPKNARARRSASKPNTTPPKGTRDSDLAAVLSAGLLRAPAELVASYRGHRITAKLLEDGTIALGNEIYESPSTAAGMARLPGFDGDLKGKRFPATNGWTFWKVRDPGSGEYVTLDSIRARHQRAREAGQ